ncbi:MAG: DUF3892 domain-containing protein [Candidatus Eremiobacteraeota bacterium]|nr:DUF3892 domain-containing protein [Candidatus Eremiobacteraeota bacterium]MBV9972258.1 DUF3892 domain-containing protein [Candidatus Eremiobacteraeota bacterium]
MAIRCVAIRMSANGYRHEHITYIQWLQDGQSLRQSSSRAEMVAFVEDGGKAYVRDQFGNLVYLRVRVSTPGNKYVQTYADGIWSDNLLALPRF